MSRCRRSPPPISRSPPRARAQERSRPASPPRGRSSQGVAQEPAITTNAEADGTLLEEIAAPDAEGRRLLADAAERMKLSARGYHRVLRVARTLADLEAAPSVRRIHIAEALAYRRIAPGR